jgi:hypothetical protein
MRVPSAKTWLAFSLVVHLLAATTLAAFPAWHHALHPDKPDDCGDDAHECLVTILSAGSAEALAPVPPDARPHAEAVSAAPLLSFPRPDLAPFRGQPMGRAPPVTATGPIPRN